MSVQLNEEQQKMLEWVKGDTEAMILLWKIAHMTQVADDLVDEDDIDRHALMTELLSLCLFEIPQNRFFQANSDRITPILATSFAMWSHTDDWGKSDDKVLQTFGYCYREITEQAVVMAAYIIGGQKHARWVAKDMVEYYRGSNQDTLEEWVQEFRE